MAADPSYTPQILDWLTKGEGYGNEQPGSVANPVNEPLYIGGTMSIIDEICAFEAPSQPHIGVLW